MSKILVEEKLLNSILKAIEIHINLIESGNVYVQDQIYKERLGKSILYLKEIPNMIKSPDKELKRIKRGVYTKYINAKKELDIAININDNKKIKEWKEKKDKVLQYYLELKKICDNIK